MQQGTAWKLKGRKIIQALVPFELHAIKVIHDQIHSILKCHQSVFSPLAYLEKVQYIFKETSKAYLEENQRTWFECLMKPPACTPISLSTRSWIHLKHSCALSMQGISTGLLLQGTPPAAHTQLPLLHSDQRNIWDTSGHRGHVTYPPK